MIEGSADSAGVSGDIVHRWPDLLARLSRLELLANNAGDYTAISIDGVIEWMSPSVSTVLGWSPAELIGRNGYSLVHPDDLDPARDARAEIDRGGARQVRVRMRCKDGSWRWVESRSRRAVDATGSATSALVSSVWDVQIEVDALARLAASEAAQAEMVARADHISRLESLGVLAGGVAHDFNNLLTAVMTYAELIVQQVGGGPIDAASVGRDAAAIMRAAERGAALTSQLLAFARKEQHVAEVVAVDELVGSTVEMLRRTLGGGIRIDLRPGAAGAEVRIDPGLFEQALVNVAVNAHDAMPGGGQLTVSTSYVHPGSERVRIDITDTGCGMTPSVAARALEPFFTTKPVGAGSGLGLSSVYGVVTRAGGTVDITSEVGRGTTVSLQLPVGEGFPRAVADGVEGRRSASATVLVVDDEPSVLEIVSRSLELEGYRVLVANGPIEARTIAARSVDIDLLLTDVLMPECSGHELADELHRARPSLRVVYMTGYMGDVDTDVGPAAAGDAVLVKPFRLDTLLRTIERALEA